MSSKLFVNSITGRTSEIIQVACVCGDEHFNVYLRPSCNISSGASAATGLTFIGGVLKLNGDPVETTSVAEGLHLFLEFVSQHPNSVMIGHNIQSFDIPILINQLSKHNMMKKFQSSVCGFIDTLKLSRRVYPKAEVGNYRQENLVKKLLGQTYSAHNALADVEILQKLFCDKLKGHCKSDDVFTLSYYSCRSSLDPLVQLKVISFATMKKLITNSLDLSKLILIHSCDQETGIRNVFSETQLHADSKKCRISKSKNVIDKVVQYLSNLMD